MKLISKLQPIPSVPVIPAEVPILSPADVIPAPAQPITEYQVSYVAEKPDPPTTIVWAIPLTWKMAGLPRPELRMSSGVQEWCKYSTAFQNWLYTCLSVFVGVSQSEINIPVPDQFIDDLDRRILTLEKNGESIHVMI